MADDTAVEKKFNVLCQIARASHFAWHRAVEEVCKGVDMQKVVHRMWEITAVDTARAYLKRLDPSKPIPAQIAKSFVWSSAAMGEDAEFVGGGSEKEAFVKHHGCPWYDWHKRMDLLIEDRSGCDAWFFKVVEEINKKLGTNVKIETLKSLPDGDSECIRRIWVE